jgi:cell division protein FtsZ
MATPHRGFPSVAGLSPQPYPSSAEPATVEDSDDGRSTGLARNGAGSNGPPRQSDDGAGLYFVQIFGTSDDGWASLHQAAAVESTRLVVAFAETDGVVDRRHVRGPSESALRKGALIVAMVAQEACEPSAAIAKRPATLGAMDPVDALVMLPPDPDVSLVSSLVDAYLCATAAGEVENSPSMMPIGGEFLDVRKLFSPHDGARVSFGHASGYLRAIRAAQRALDDAGPQGLSRSASAVVMVAGSRLLKLNEIATVVDTIRAAAPHAELQLNVHYDERLGEVLRVTLIAASHNSRG